MKKENAYEKREKMKSDLEKKYCKNKEPSNEFIDSFAKKYDVCLPRDVLFDEDARKEQMFCENACNYSDK